MSIEVMFELQQEVRRLFIAGSGLAAGDLRLQRLLPRLQKLGEAAPVFNRLALAVSQTLEAEAGASAGKLLELGTLLHSVLYTQGKTESKEIPVPLEGTEIKLGTTIPYRRLGPLLEALTQKGQGRMEQLRQGYEDRSFQDFRIIPAAVTALDESYAEIPDFLEQKVFPDYGREALPELKKQFSPEGGKGDARRLLLIHDLLKSSCRELLLSSAREGSTEVRAAAVSLLGQYPEQEDFLLEQADDKKKEIRRASYFALAELGTDAAVSRLYKALQSKDRELAIEPIQACRANTLTLSVISNAEESLEKLLQRVSPEEAGQQLLADIRSLDGKRVPEVVSFLQMLLSTNGFIVPETEAVQEAAAQLLLDLDLLEADRFAVSLHEEHNRRFIGYSFKAAVKLLPPEDVYERYCSDLKDKRQPYAKELLCTLHELTVPLERRLFVQTQLQEASPHAQSSSAITWDTRWSRLFIELDEEELVCRFAGVPDPKVAGYLAGKCREKPNLNRDRTSRMLLALFGMGAPDAPELLMEVLEKGGTKQFYYLDRVQLALLAMLPGSYAERLRNFAETLSYQGMKTQLLDIVESIKANPEQAEWPEQKGQGLWEWIRSKMW
jgi:HEAT repeat protein